MLDSKMPLAPKWLQQTSVMQIISDNNHLIKQHKEAYFLAVQGLRWVCDDLDVVYTM